MYEDIMKVKEEESYMFDEPLKPFEGYLSAISLENELKVWKHID